MSLKEKLTNFFGLTDEEDYYEESVVAQESVRSPQNIAVNQGSSYVAPRTTRAEKSNEYIFTKPYAITAKRKRSVQQHQVRPLKDNNALSKRQRKRSFLWPNNAVIPKQKK